MLQPTAGGEGRGCWAPGEPWRSSFRECGRSSRDCLARAQREERLGDLWPCSGAGGQVADTEFLFLSVDSWTRDGSPHVAGAQAQLGPWVLVAKLRSLPPAFTWGERGGCFRGED